MPRPNNKQFFLENAWFFYACFLFLIVGGIALGSIENGDLLLFFSDHRSSFGDFFFRYFTKMGEEVAYILALIGLVFVGYRYVVFLPVIGIVVTIVAFASKAFFKHPRPRLYYQELGTLDQINLVDQVSLHGGANSFPSGHTMSAFALYAFIAFCLPRKKGVALILFIFALLVGLSRIYLVQHFLKDVYLGAIMGVLIAILIYWGQSLLSNQPNKWWNKFMRVG